MPASRRVRRLAAVLVVALLGAAQAGCADEAALDSSSTNSTTLTVWSSLPLQGPEAARSRDILDGQKLALRQAGGRVGPFTVKLSSLDDASPEAQGWDPEVTAENARRALRDRTTIAYLGESDSGATAISLPILNASGIPQVSPQAGYPGFTREEGAGKGEPERFYPSGKRTFARVVPSDTAEAAALATAMADRGCTRLAILERRDLTGRGLARALRAAADSRGIGVAVTIPVTDDSGPGEVAEDVRAARADCAAYAGGTGAGTAELLDGLHAADAGLRLFGGSALAVAPLTEALAPGTQARTLLAVPATATGAAPRAMREAFRETYGRPASAAAAYGHASMQAVLRAIAAAGPVDGGNRRRVAEELLGLEPAPSAVGSLGLGEDGDPVDAQVDLRAIRGGRLVAP